MFASVRAMMSEGSVSSPSTSGFSPSDSSKKKRLPLPGSLSTPTVPPISSMRRLVMASPIPAPSTSARALIRVNGVKSIPRSPSVSPAPVSVTERTRRVSPRGVHVSVTVPPALLYFTPFESRFKSTCFKRVLSATT